MDRYLTVNVIAHFILAENAQDHTALFQLENKLEDLARMNLPGVELHAYSIETEE